MKKFGAIFLSMLVCALLPVNLLAADKKLDIQTLSRITAKPPTWVRPQIGRGPRGLSPAQVKSAYHLPQSGGSGTIAVIDAYNSPTIESDLDLFSQQFGLAKCDTKNGCLEKHMMSAQVAGNGGWGLEIALDTEWAHAVAPNAKILLVEAASSSIYDLLSAIDYANTRPDVVAVSMSWGGDEFPGEDTLDNHLVNSSKIDYFAASGDSGHGVIWPSVSSMVTAVGGTSLHLDNKGNVAMEMAWGGSGGGVSQYVSAPSYQSSINIAHAGGKRAVPDVSYNADPNTGYSVYDSTSYYGMKGWFTVGGTSAGAPQWAAIKALGSSANNSAFYKDAAASTYSKTFRDIVVGSNGSCQFFCLAGPGYDFVTGLGSPLTTKF